MGAVIVRGDRTLSYGYNGTPPGEDNNCEDLIDGILVTKPNVIHAEDNAIRKVHKEGEVCHGATMFTTHAPCKGCAEKIASAGIVTVYYRNKYRSQDGLELLKLMGIEAIHYD